MQKKYQIFLSSTYEDLKTERQQAIKAILEMGHIPVGMEMFSAGDETQWQLIKRQIEDCDYYIVIVAHRYGSLDNDISYTEKEYNYATSIGVPVLGFVLNDKSRWPKTKMDFDPVIVEKLNNFKARISQKIIDHWNSATDLKTKVAIALIKQVTINPREGWVRASTIPESDILNEISRLSKENSQLRSLVDTHQDLVTAKAEENLNRVVKLLNINKITIALFYIDGVSWENEKEVTYARVFSLLSPELYVGKATENICEYLGVMLNSDKKRSVRRPYATPTNTVKIILADFAIMGIVTAINKNKDYNSEIWEITEFGKDVYASIRLKMLEKNYPKNEEKEVD